MSSPCQACLHEQKEREDQRSADNIELNVGGQTVQSHYTQQTHRTTPGTTRHSARVSFGDNQNMNYHSQNQLHRRQRQEQFDLMQIIDNGGKVEIPIPQQFNDLAHVMSER